MKIFALLTDAYGGRGGIAKFNRDLLAALAAWPPATHVEAYPRLIPEPVEGVPPGVTFYEEAAGGKDRYVRAVGARILRGGYDAVVCGHVNLLPLAHLAAARARVPLITIVHGVEVWEAPEGRLACRVRRAGLARSAAVVAVSDFTRRRLLAWAGGPGGLEATRAHVVPNCIDAAPFGPGPPRADLVERYRLRGRRVLLTLARLSAAEQYKGIDEILEALPALTQHVPNVTYLVCGDGNDRPRLEAKARSLGLAGRVVFTGYVPEDEKADYYRLADAFAMPGRGEGFGIVYLEAMACGIPVVASVADASREAVRDGALGFVADPDDQTGLVTTLRDALAAPKKVPPGLAYFSPERFTQRWHEVLDRVFLLSPEPVT
ncbi:MAG: glycosyltransferase [Rubricoccaceae bacterium]